MCPTKALKIIYKSFSNVYFNGGYLKKSKAGFPKVGRIAPLGAILVKWGAKTCKGAKGGRF